MMDIHFIDFESDDFPHPSVLQTKDLAVIGSNLRPSTLIKAYRMGYFPWFNPGEVPCWFHIDPRMVLFPANLKVSKSMRQIVHQNKFTLTINKCFKDVVRACRYVQRNGCSGNSWISDEIEEAYGELHKRGIALSVEAWNGDLLAGGFYGLQMGKVFFGESMFSKESNASKFALIQFVENFVSNGGQMIDCQQETRHLSSMGAAPIPRREFVSLLEKWIPQNENVW